MRSHLNESIILGLDFLLPSAENLAGSGKVHVLSFRPPKSFVIDQSFFEFMPKVARKNDLHSWVCFSSCARSVH